MKPLLYLVLAMPLLLQAQTSVKEKNKSVNLDQGIKFINGLTWKQVLKKARQENKYIFVDCFATWCGPCKVMEQEEFTKPEAGAFFNKYYLSVRLQMDKTKQDNEQVRNWYSVAAEMSKEYGIPAYPTFLFFDPQGRLVNRHTGYNSYKAIVDTARSAMQRNRVLPYRVYYSRLAQYLQGKRDYTIMAGLADTALQLRQKEIAEEVVKLYRPYLLEQKGTEWYQPSNLSFMASFMQGSQDPFFQVFLKNGKKVDSILQQQGLAENVVDKIIQKEEIEPVVQSNKGARLSTDKLVIRNEPNWNGLEEIITAKYGAAYATRNILQAKILWYSDQHRWTEVAQFLTVFSKNYRITFIRGRSVTFFIVNAEVWKTIFLRSVDMEQINAGIDLMKQIIDNTHPPYSAEWDTYANLLYKAGRRDEAIRYQEKALALEPGKSSLIETLRRMKERLPTWPHVITNDFWDGGLID